jgi:hypothetical protein
MLNYQTTQDPRMENSRRSLNRSPNLGPTSRCCDDRLNPVNIWPFDIPSVWQTIRP